MLAIVTRSRFAGIAALAEDNDGLVTAAQARAIGVTDSALVRMAQRGRLERAVRGVYRIPFFPTGPLTQYREAVLWAQASHGPQHVALSHATALALYGLSDVSPAQIHLTVPRSARLRREQPRWIVVHRGGLAPDDLTQHEGLPVTTVERSISDFLAASGRLDLVRQAVLEARREGYLDASQARRLQRRLNLVAHGHSLG